MRPTARLAANTYWVSARQIEQPLRNEEECWRTPHVCVCFTRISSKQWYSLVTSSWDDVLNGAMAAGGANVELIPGAG